MNTIRIVLAMEMNDDWFDAKRAKKDGVWAIISRPDDVSEKRKWPTKPKFAREEQERDMAIVSMSTNRVELTNKIGKKYVKNTFESMGHYLLAFINSCSL